MSEIIRQTFIEGYLVSTVLPLDTRGLYETMVFKTNTDNEVIVWSAIYSDHYETKQEAKENHNETVVMYENLENNI